ncbi:MAG: hypothetical protein ACK4RZ_17125 [Paracoccaceae bacterium]
MPTPFGLTSPFWQTTQDLIQDHIDPCLEGIIGPLPRDPQAKVEDVRLVTHYF